MEDKSWLKITTFDVPSKMPPILYGLMGSKSSPQQLSTFLVSPSIGAGVQELTTISKIVKKINVRIILDFSPKELRTLSNGGKTNGNYRETVRKKIFLLSFSGLL
ncbi:MAG TPA: hypothetical protein VFF21_10245 [Flavobacteriaceae bacterium]|nr:hypothetical protein [Flavobacteriaceae bacterium]